MQRAGSRPGWFSSIIVAGIVCLVPASAAWGQCGSGRMGARALVGPSSMNSSMSPAWLMQMQAQMAQAQMLQAQMAQAQMTQAQVAQAQQMLMARGFAAGLGQGAPPPTQPPSRPPSTRIKSSRPAAPPPAPAREVEQPLNPAIDAARLGADLVHGAADQQDLARQRLKNGKGADYTEALAAAIPRLDGDARIQARDALVERLARMTAATLRDKLADDDIEIRRAAALACAMRDERTFIPDLIAVMEKQPDSPIVPALRIALKSLSERDFGPAAQATTEQRSRAVAAWKGWWQTASQN